MNTRCRSSRNRRPVRQQRSCQVLVLDMQREYFLIIEHIGSPPIHQGHLVLIQGGDMHLYRIRAIGYSNSDPGFVADATVKEQSVPIG